MEYKILHHHTYAGLSGEVSLHLRLGWKLHGSLVIDNNQFYQPVIKEK